MKIKCFYRSSLDGVCSGAIYDMSINKSNYDSIDFIPVELGGSFVLDDIDASTTVLFLGVFLTEGQLSTVRSTAGLVIYINNLDCNYALNFDGSKFIGKVDYTTSLPEVVWSFFQTDVVPVPVWLLGSYFIQRDLSGLYYFWQGVRHDDVYKDLCVPFYYYAMSLDMDPSCNSWDTLFEHGWRINFMTLGVGYLSRLVGYAEVGLSIMYYPGNLGYVKSVNGKSGDVTLTKFDLSLGNVDNTSDLDKPVSRDVQKVFDSISSELSELSFSIDSINSSIAEINSRLDDLDSDYSSLSGSLSDLDSSVSSLESSFDTLSDRLGEIESSLSTLDDRVSALESK